MKTEDALSLLVALEERVARMYFNFFCLFRQDEEVARCWWDLALEEYGHAGILKMVRGLVTPGMDLGEPGGRLWALVETVEQCEREALGKPSLGRAFELAIRIESSELDALGHRILQSLGADLPEGAARPFAATDAHRRRLAEAAGRISDRRIQRRLQAILGATRGT